jgi:hypothetical protein
MKESLFEDILAKYPQLIEEGLVLVGRQMAIYGRRMDLVFKDTFGRQLIVELKAGPIKDEHIGQIMSYEGSMLSHDNPDLRIMLVGTRVPPNIQRSLDHHGIAWKEIALSVLQKYLQSVGDEALLGGGKEDQIQGGVGVAPRIKLNGARNFSNKLSYWKFGCKWDGGASFYDVIKRREIVIGVPDEFIEGSLFEEGTYILITEGFLVKAIAKVLEPPRRVITDNGVLSDLKEYIPPQALNERVTFAKAEWRELTESEQFQYKVQRGMCRINKEDIIKKVNDIVGQKSSSDTID